MEILTAIAFIIGERTRSLSAVTYDRYFHERELIGFRYISTFIDSLDSPLPKSEYLRPRWQHKLLPSSLHWFKIA